MWLKGGKSSMIMVDCPECGEPMPESDIEILGRAQDERGRNRVVYRVVFKCPFCLKLVESYRFERGGYAD